MGAFFRSEKMSLAQLFIQPEAAYSIISELGEIGIVQFRDLNENVSAFDRKFVNEVRRCNEMERKLKYIATEVSKNNVDIPDVRQLPKAPNPREIIDLEAHLEKTEGDIREFSESAVGLKSNFQELTELKYVLEKTQIFFNEHNEISSSLDNNALVMEDSQNPSNRGKLEFLAGVIQRERVPAFERMLWRISRGNIFLRQADIVTIEDPLTGNEINKTVFVAFFQGEQLKTRIKKVCTGFRASMYHCPSNAQERNEILQDVRIRIKDLEMVLNQTRDHRLRVLVNVAKELQNWGVMVIKMKAIYHTLNMFNVDVIKKCLIGECWVATRDIGILQKSLLQGSSTSGSSIPSFMNIINAMGSPPTYNITNKITKGFQNLIDAYGVASYREVNPGLYTIITFPFLFGVMFGDMGHGAIMLLAALALVLMEKKFLASKNQGEIFNYFFAGRYIILFMSIFSIYTGFIYNDVFSKSINVFGSSWNVSFTMEEIRKSENLDLHVDEKYLGTPPILGMDPLWRQSTNEIKYLNSFKMKLSIILGVTHMIFGVFLSIPNYIYFKKRADIFLQFIPQILFLCCIFLWLVIMVFLKWVMYSGDSKDAVYSAGCAPNILLTFINMMLLKNMEKADNSVCDPYFFDFQGNLQKILLGIAVAMIPVMLFGKPIMFKLTRGKKSGKRHNATSHEDGRTELMRTGDNSGSEENNITSKSTSEGNTGGHGESDDFGEVMIYQAIHTVEYVLSTISHTASYLRLWALSLAHAQLSQVLWTKVFSMALQADLGYKGVVAIFLIFPIWAFFSVAILVIMEGLSAFLHTLRLHWVEFMSKFYVGEGYIFEPFNFDTIINEAEGE